MSGRAVGFIELFCCRQKFETVVARGTVVAYRCSLDDLPEVFGAQSRLQEVQKLQKGAKKEYLTQRSGFIG